MIVIHPRASLVSTLLGVSSVLPLLSAQEPQAREATASRPSSVARAALEHANALLQNKDLPGARAALVTAIEADPDLLEAHDLLLKVVGDTVRQARDRSAEVHAELEKQYEAWSSRHPDSLGIAYGRGSALYAQEDPRAKPFLLAVIAKDKKLAKVYQMLAIDAERWGDEAGAREYLRQATVADPASPDYAFYYASSFQHVDPKRWVEASLGVAERFPTSERGAQALYWLGERTQDDAKKIEFWERARTAFPPDKFSWTSSAMPGLFDAHLRTDPAKAIALAKAMPEDRNRRGGDANGWAARAKFAEDYVAATAALAAKEYEKAEALLAGMKPDRRSSNAERLALLAADAKVGLGKPEAAFDMLTARLAATPEDATRAALFALGKKLGKSEQAVNESVWKLRDATTKPAPEFALGVYGSEAKATLADYRGKVILLTFWFPGCGPCRGEFPHFENVIGKFQGKPVAYLGINVDRKQDDYVMSFMKGTKYSFTPLQGDGLVEKPEAFNARGCPTNFLIDQRGRIVYRDFMIHGENEVLLQRMIESLLERPSDK